MENLIITCHNLMQSNDGKFKSEKQKNYILSQTVFGAIVHSGITYNTSWTDSFNFDDEGIVEYVRNSNKKGLTILWERGQKTKKQISIEKQHAKRAKHEKIEAEYYPIFKQDCIDTFGYVIDKNKVDNLYSAIQSCELGNILRTCNYKITTEEMIAYAEKLPMLEEMKIQHELLAKFLQKHRIKNLEISSMYFSYLF